MVNAWDIYHSRLWPPIRRAGYAMRHTSSLYGTAVPWCMPWQPLIKNIYIIPIAVAIHCGRGTADCGCASDAQQIIRFSIIGLRTNYGDAPSFHIFLLKCIP